MLGRKDSGREGSRIAGAPCRRPVRRETHLPRLARFATYPATAKARRWLDALGPRQRMSLRRDPEGSNAETSDSLTFLGRDMVRARLSFRL